MVYSVTQTLKMSSFSSVHLQNSNRSPVNSLSIFSSEYEMNRKLGYLSSFICMLKRSHTPFFKPSSSFPLVCLSQTPCPNLPSQILECARLNQFLGLKASQNRFPFLNNSFNPYFQLLLVFFQILVL